MALVVLRPPLRDLAGGASRIDVEGDTVGEIIARLEATYPRLTGWVTDERGAIRQHVNIFVNEDLLWSSLPEARLRRGDVVHILPSVAGG